MLKNLFGLFSNDIFIDLGTANTLVFAKKQGIIIDEPSVVAIRERKKNYNGSNKRKVAAVGLEAKQMLGRTPVHLTAVRPMKDGVITDFTMAEKMLQYFIYKVYGNKFFLHGSPRVLISMPCRATEVERHAIREAAEGAGAREVYLMEEPMAAAIGAGMPVNEATGSMVLDIGGGTTEIGILSLNGVVYSESIRTGGDRFDEAIINYVRQRYNLLIGEATAEQAKQEIGSAYPMNELQEIEVRGRHVAEGVPGSVKINSNEILSALQEPLTNITDGIKKVLERVPPELSSDIMLKGIVLTGGGALLRNIDRLLMEDTGLPVTIADDPLTCVARGGGHALEIMEKQGVDVFDFDDG
jgi:rod shape-determining protein MreB and related proteins